MKSSIGLHSFDYSLAFSQNMLQHVYMLKSKLSQVSSKIQIPLRKPPFKLKAKQQNYFFHKHNKTKKVNKKLGLFPF